MDLNQKPTNVIPVAKEVFEQGATLPTIPDDLREEFKVALRLAVQRAYLSGHMDGVLKPLQAPLDGLEKHLKKHGLGH